MLEQLPVQEELRWVRDRFVIPSRTRDRVDARMIKVLALAVFLFTPSIGVAQVTHLSASRGVAGFAVVALQGLTPLGDNFDSGEDTSFGEFSFSDGASTTVSFLNKAESSGAINSLFVEGASGLAFVANGFTASQAGINYPFYSSNSEGSTYSGAIWRFSVDGTAIVTVDASAEAEILVDPFTGYLAKPKPYRAQPSNSSTRRPARLSSRLWLLIRAQMA